MTIQAALTAASAAGSTSSPDNNARTVYPPAGTYKTSSTLVISGSYVRVIGSGIGQAIIKPSPGATNVQYDVISTEQPPSSTASGYTYYRGTLSNFTIDYTSLAAATPQAGQGNGIYLFGASYWRLLDVHILNCPNWGIVLDATTANDSYDTFVERCQITNCSAAKVWHTEHRGICAVAQARRLPRFRDGVRRQWAGNGQHRLPHNREPMGHVSRAMHRG